MAQSLVFPSSSHVRTYKNMYYNAGNEVWPACKESITRTVRHFQSVCLGLDALR